MPNIMGVVLVNLLFVIAVTVFSALLMHWGAGIRFNSPVFKVVERGHGRILAMYQTHSFINNNPVFNFTIEVSVNDRVFTLHDHYEAVQYIALASFKENCVYSILLGADERQIAFEKDHAGRPILIDANACQAP